MWPWRTFDTALGEILPGDLIVVAGKTASGKSTFAMNLAWKLAHRGERVGYFALECGEDIPVWMQLMQWGVSRFAEREPHRKEILDQARLLPDWPATLQIVDSPFPRPDQILADVTDMESEKYGIILVDHLAAIDTTQGKAAERQVFGKVVRRLKAVAERKQIPVVVIHQMGRGERNRADFYRAPKADDLYGSSIIEHTASIILGIYRTLDEDGRNLLQQYNKGHDVPMWRHEVGMGVRVLKARHGAKRWDLHLIPEQDENGHKTDLLGEEDAEYQDINAMDILRNRQP